MDFGALPPEINSGRMYSGPGSGPMLAAAAAWDQAAVEMYSAAASYSSVISGLTDGSWRGPASASMAAAAAPYAAWMNAAATQAEQTATQAEGGRVGIRDSVRRHRATAGDRCQPGAVGDVGCHQFLGDQYRGHHGD